MRLFVAINFNEKTTKNLQTMLKELQASSTQGKFTSPENLHLTLSFLDECNEKQVDAAKVAMSGVVFQPFDLQIDSLGRFKRRGGEVWWAGVYESSALLNLHHQVSSKLRENGFKLERLTFSPHITLGSEVKTTIKQKQIEPFGEITSSIHLMKSERIDGKFTNTSIYCVGKDKMTSPDDDFGLKIPF